jgi:hypothetical protein
VGTGAQREDSAADESAAEAAKQEAIKKIMELMNKAGISKPQQNEAEEIYEKVKKFLENTGFNPALIPPGKY